MPQCSVSRSYVFAAHTYTEPMPQISGSYSAYWASVSSAGPEERIQPSCGLALGRQQLLLELGTRDAQNRLQQVVRGQSRVLGHLRGDRLLLRAAAPRLSALRYGPIAEDCTSSRNGCNRAGG